MAVLAAPQRSAFCVDAIDENILKTPSTAVLDALRKIRKIETSKDNKGRLQQLDARIETLQGNSQTE